MTLGYPIFECIPVIPIMDQAKNEHTPVRKSDYEVGSFYSSETNDDITEY